MAKARGGTARSERRLPMTFTAVFTQAPEGDYAAMVEEIPGAISEGDSID